VRPVCGWRDDRLRLCESRSVYADCQWRKRILHAESDATTAPTSVAPPPAELLMTASTGVAERSAMRKLHLCTLTTVRLRPWLR
jgi:hypothetical protein